MFIQDFALEWTDLSFYVEKKRKRMILNPFPGVEEIKILNNGVIVQFNTYIHLFYKIKIYFSEWSNS